GSTTGSINLVAHAYGRGVLQPGDEVITSLMEHHSNFVPWQQLRDDHGIVLKFIPVKDDGTLDLEAYGSLLSPRTKLVALTHVSNVLGTCNPIAECAQMAHQLGAKLLVDGSQAVMHSPVDVKALDVDFYAFTGHKIYGPTGIGVLYGRKALLDSMPPFMGGGEMIARVHPDATVWADPPARFEAGTPPIVQAIGLGAAIDFVASVGFEAIGAHEQRLKHAAIGALRALDGVRVYGHEDHSDAAFSSGPIISFSLRGCHPHDVATLLDMEGIAVRAGHHCAEPLAQFFGLESGSLRASLALYNSEDEIHKLVSALEKAKRILT
ncbi:MAG: cysteine desulfurase, partial [Pseudomonadota bacterium]